MAGLMRHLEEGESAEPVIAITFDDGYEDNYRNAFPILERYGLPATVFLTTGSIDSGEPLWFEQLAGAVKTSSREFIDLEFDIPRRFALKTLSQRLRANSEIFRLLRQMDDCQRRERLAEVLRQLGPAPPSNSGLSRMLTWEQIRQMKAGGIDFGGHTVTHPFLSKVAPEQACWEISECKSRIEQELQKPVDYFAYPNGREEDFAKRNKELLRNAGYRAAMTTIWGINDCSTDPMELRRGSPWEEDPALFAFKLDWYQWANQ
jgi:peptidoglycan/xylan/chitin deacetylase (PgdA/CDA1 family)